MVNPFGNVPASEVNDFHNSSDVDSGVRAQHHTLGEGAMQAAAGNHKHKIADIKDFIPSTTITLTAGPKLTLGSLSYVRKLSPNLVFVNLNATVGSVALAAGDLLFTLSNFVVFDTMWETFNNANVANTYYRVHIDPSSPNTVAPVQASVPATTLIRSCYFIPGTFV